MQFASLDAGGHRRLDFLLPTGIAPWHPWLRQRPWFPPAPSRSPDDVYRTWFGDADRPIVNYHLMGGAPPEWDAEIRRCYQHALREAADGGLASWEGSPRGKVAKMILADQMSRHIHRGKPEAYATDALALRLADDRTAGSVRVVFEAWSRPGLWYSRLAAPFAAFLQRRVNLGALDQLEGIARSLGRGGP